MKNLRNESLIVRNELIEKIKNKCNVDFGISFNDLYLINNKKVEVRRLKGYLNNNEICWYSNIKKYNDKFEEVKKFVESLEYKDFKIELNKIRNNYRNEYYRNFSINNNLNYKKYCNEINYNESCLILKISYNI
jgi:hypothetical protein